MEQWSQNIWDWLTNITSWGDARAQLVEFYLNKTQIRFLDFLQKDLKWTSAEDLKELIKVRAQ